MNDIELDHKIINTIYNPPTKLDRKCRCKECRGVADVEDRVVLTSYPAKYSYHCPECGNNGYCYCSETWFENKSHDKK